MLESKATSLNDLWTNIIIEELLRNKITKFVLSPGSRCSPLTAAVALNKNIHNPVVHYDERGAAFYALGSARASNKPAVLICTSGTAIANYYPAVVEASMDMIPLIIITADRPPELRQTGANQTINQVNMYGSYIRYYFDMPCPNENLPPEFVLTTIDQAIYRAISAPAGPVHLNCMFREPLASIGKKKDYKSYVTSVNSWQNNTNPFTTYFSSDKNINNDTLKEVTAILNKEKKGILVVSGLKKENDRKAVIKLIEKLSWPAFVDIRSGLKLGAKASNIISYYDQILLSDKFSRMKQPLTVLHVGGNITSKRLNLFIQQNEIEKYIHIDNHPFRWDPNHQISHRLEVDISNFVKKVMPLLAGKTTSLSLKYFQKADRVIGNIIDNHIQSELSLSEIAVSRLVSRFLSKNSCLFLSSSMPIRDMDMYADPKSNDAIVTSNRGASGIDGSLATAVGFFESSGKAGTIVMGDLAMLHDLNSLGLVKKQAKPITIVVINNNGGGIFSFLPVAGLKNIFEPFFGTPHNFTFENAAQMFGLNYFCPNTIDSFVKTYQKSQKLKGGSVIEIFTDRNENKSSHEILQGKIKAVIDKL